MAKFEDIIEVILANEGGSTLVTDPTDKGGTTRYGISAKSFPNVDIVKLTKEQAIELYRQNYWSPIKGDQIVSQKIALAVLDTSVLNGVNTTIKLVQKALKIPEKDIDGIMGSGTLLYLNSIIEEQFLNAFKLAKIERYVNIVKNDKSQIRFLVGWINRTLKD